MVNSRIIITEHQHLVYVTQQTITASNHLRVLLLITIVWLVTVYDFNRFRGNPRALI